MLVSVLSEPAKGGTFLSWSLYYLSGAKQYYHGGVDRVADLVDNPVLKNNAHGFYPNHMNPLDNTVPDDYSDKLIHNLKQHNTRLNVAYLHNYSGFDETSRNKRLVNLVTELSDKIVIVTNNKKHALYDATFGERVPLHAKLTDNRVVNKTYKEQFDDFVDFFLKDSLAQWDRKLLDDPWEMREFLALSYDSQSALSILPIVDLQKDHYLLDFFQMINSLDFVIEDLLRYLDIEVDRNRLVKWSDVYQQWRKIHYHRFQFATYFDIIVEYIIKGYNMDLTRFNLDLLQESAIQQELIKKYSKTLKAYGLVKFTNTLELYNLLEDVNE